MQTTEQIREKISQAMAKMRYRDAIRLTERALEADSRDVEMIRRCALAYDQLGVTQKLIKIRKAHLNRAFRLLSRAIRISPEDPEVWHTRSIVGLHLQKLSLAQSSVHRALRIAPNHPSYLISLANIYRAAGQPQKALPLYRSVMRKKKGNALLALRFNIAMTQKEIGNTRAAQRTIQKSLSTVTHPLTAVEREIVRQTKELQKVL